MKGELWNKYWSKKVPSLPYIYSMCFHQKDIYVVNVIDQKISFIYTLFYSEYSFFLKHLNNYSWSWKGCLQCGFGPFLALHFIVRFSQNHNHTAPHFCNHMCDVVQCSLAFSQNHNCTAPHFCSHMCGVTYKTRFEAVIVFKLWAFLAQPKTDFSLYFGPSFKLLN